MADDVSRSVSQATAFGPTQAARDAEARTPHLHNVDELVALIPGSKRATWLRHWIPELKRSGVLVKRGRRFLGRPVDVVNALLGVPATVAAGRAATK
jgi:hypothetical protein